MPLAASSLEILVTSSFAAFSVKVATRMLEGSTPFSCTRYDTRLTRVKVFPVPGPAVMSKGPSVEVIARRCASFALPKSKQDIAATACHLRLYTDIKQYATDSNIARSQ